MVVAMVQVWVSVLSLIFKALWALLIAVGVSLFALLVWQLCGGK